MRHTDKPCTLITSGTVTPRVFHAVLGPEEAQEGGDTTEATAGTGQQPQLHHHLPQVSWCSLLPHWLSHRSLFMAN